MSTGSEPAGSGPGVDPSRIGAEARAGASSGGETFVLPLAEETVRIDKREAVTGRVRVRTVSHERIETVSHDLAQERVEITRVPFDREVDVAPTMRSEGDVTIIPVLEEVLVVETRLVLKEEIHIRRTREIETVETPVVLRRQDAVVERFDADNEPEEPLP